MLYKLIKTIFFASFVWIAGVILAQDALGADTVVYAIIGGTDSLGTIDLNTGVFTQISTVAVSDYELGVYGGALYGAGAQCGCLIQLNTSTGVPTFAPTYFQQNASGFGVLNGFGSTTGGLFAMAAAIPGGVNYLWSINPATGVPTQIGSTGVIAGGGTGYLSASNDSSKLYWEGQNLPGESQSNGYTDTLYSINTSTGAATLIGTWTFNGYSNTGNPFSMVFTGGTLWANFYSSGFGTINTSSGAQTLVSTGKSLAFFGIAPDPLGPAVGGSSSYYFSHLAFAGEFQTTLTYINYSPETVTCVTNFYGNAGTPLAIPFSQGTITTRTDILPPGGSIHDPTTATLSGLVTDVAEGWAQASCTGPVEAGLLYRLYNSSGTPVGEASVNAETAPTTEFATFAQATAASSTGIAYANPSTTQTATITITAYNESGTSLGSKIVTLGPLQHGAANVGAAPLEYPNFTGSVEITSTSPILSFSLNAEAFPVFFSLPPGDLPSSTQLESSGGSGTTSGSQSYYFSQLAFSGEFETTLTYINYSPETVTCVTNFYANAGTPLSIPFSQGTISTRTDVLPPGGSIHDATTASLTASVSEGWAQATCTGPVEAGLLYRLYSSGTPVSEASVNAETAPTTEFATFAQATAASSTGIAYANPSTTQSASITIEAYNELGTSLGSQIVTLAPLQHGAANVGAAPLGFSAFTGFVKITSTVPILSFSLNAEAYPVLSSLPPGDLPGSTTLVP
jgi:hypothetical protein